MKTIDMHCDTLMCELIENGKAGSVTRCPKFSVDVERLVKAGALAQFFAIFMLREQDYKEAHVPAKDYEDYIDGCVQIFERTLRENPDTLARARNAGEIEQNYKNGKVSAVLTMEDGAAVYGTMENLKRYYDLGVRALSLTWNYENCFGYPNSKDRQIMEQGLKPFGKEAVSYMQELGMLVDVSHLSDGGFWDVIKIAKKPVVATHSNARSVCDHPRNMTDEMIRALGENGGVMGINFCPAFLEEKEDPVSSVERMVAMARHESNAGGMDIVALGTDFDGIEGTLEIRNPLEMELLADGLKKAGFTSSQIDGIFWKNALRVCHESM